ncbi:MAG: UDP-N-acetylglucosamine--N-acetylmuramyl-(pentapeptide) pyrophosphoryl-undecaprenol N-acetylglucosamine transferase [Sphaerochaetaceae bacterium]|nr:UDP-N-acetylglucosamine--N-acetylmuramyl-(pentapeptide) pyrophosphoryl-undecaprenol N-acetylglucosamine transferase [Sphaerochaetaceae bacterium]
MKVIFTGGGTLGHVIPAITVAKELKERRPDFDLLYIGGKKKNEREYVEANGFRFIPIPSGKLRRYFSFENFLDFFRFLSGIVCAYFVVGREKPDLIFSKGGFVSVPVVLAGAVHHVPVITHESDISMGLANRINSHFARKICFGFDVKQKDERYVYTGNPIRREILESTASRDERPLILVLGGSLGARSLNECIYAHLDELTKEGYVVHQTGPTGKDIEHANYEHHIFINEELPSLMRRATVVISRSGANTISELRSVKALMVLFPLQTNASRGDQIENAHYLEERGEALVGKDGDDLIRKVISVLKDKDLRDSLYENLSRENLPSASRIIVDIILKEIL